MAAQAATDHPLPPAASYMPSRLSTQDSLLVSRISLPPNPTIYYTLLKSASADAIELARQSILSRYATSPIQSSILTSVSIDHDPHMFLFKLENSSSSVGDVFRHVTFDGLTIQEMSSFSPPDASALFPHDDDKRILIVHFFDALRSRLIQDIIDSASKKASLSQRHIKRFKSGFLLSQISPPSGWEYKAITRSLVFCHLQIHFSYTSEGIPSHLVIHPMLLSTPFLDISPSLPLPAGTPITLLPFGTPAYFLACYSGPTAGLTKQFHLVLQGLGAGEWDNSSASPVRSPAFIIGWIKVENKQGEDKGLTIIYPTKLCLLCHPITSSRGPLDYIPELPAPLQPSPQASRFHSSSEFGSVPAPIHTSQASFISSPPSESFNSFRALTLSSNDLEQAAAEVGEYIDAVARERERERERLRREREIGTVISLKSARIPPTTPVTMATESIEQSMSSSSTLSSALPPISLPPSSPGPSTPQPTQSSSAIQTFYPSPPQSGPTLGPPTEATTAPSADQVATEQPPESQGASFDAYDMDSTWSRPKDNYLDMDNMDFVMNDIELDFNLNIGPMPNASSAGPTISPFDGRENTTIGTAGIELEGAFTDDDFSFFDQPSRPDRPLRQSPNLRVRSARPSTLLSSSLSGSSIGSKISPPNSRDLSDLHTTQLTAQLYTPGGFKDDFTPRSPIDHIDSGPPGLLPASRGPTPESHSVPSTPTVHLELDSSPKRPVAITRGLTRMSAGLFEPIPFAAYHREADDKYVVGKFALPSPPPEDGLADGTSMSLPVSTSRIGLNGGWRFEYNAVTDPRVGLVRKLIGVKRKLPSVGSKSDNPPSKKAFWTVAQEDWDCRVDLTHENEGSDADSVEDGADAEESDNTAPSRPTTPAPSYLPLGPTLLSAHFQHSHLLPLSAPLRPPGAAIRPLNLASTNNPTPSVPTPVSPAATMSVASERSRSLEAAASAVAVEVVENPLWAESWKANVVGVGSVGGIWSTDIKAVQKLWDCIPGLETSLTVAELFGLVDTVCDSNVITAGPKSTVHPMEAPMISIGKGEAVIQVLPPALRFWEKLGLCPKGGRKNVAAFVMFEENAQQQPLMGKWLESFRNAYQAKHYGVVTPGQSTACPSNGLVPLRFDATFRKSLGAFISSLTAPRPTTVVFFVLPISILSLTSPVLRQILSVSKKVLANYHACQILFEFIPEQHLYTGLSKTSAYDSTLDILSASVYNRILVPVDRLRFWRVDIFDGRKDDTRFYSMAPSFTLARPMHNKVSFLRAAHTSLDVMDRYTLLHVAYHLTPCRKWIIACCIDQRGENYDLGVWLTHSPEEHEGEAEYSEEERVVKKVWDFAMQFARKTNVEWRVIFAKLGNLSLPEMEAWTAYLGLNVLPSREQNPLHHTLVCVIPDTPWFFLPSKPSPLNHIRSLPSSAKPPVIFTDISSTTYAIFPKVRLPISMSPSQCHLESTQSFIPESLISHSNVTSSPYLRPTQTSCPQPGKSPSSLSRVFSEMDQHAMPLLPHSSSILVRIPHVHDSTTASHNSMIHIHLLRTYHSAPDLPPTASQPAPAISDDKQLLEDVTRNYYELSVLSKARWKLDGVGGHEGLPFHLAATDAMRMALDRDWDRFDGTVEP